MIFFRRLYSKDDNIKRANLSEIFHNVDLPHLNVDTATSLDRPFTMVDITEAVKNMSNNKSPGMDCFTVEFVKFFWEEISPFIMRALVYSFDIGNLPSLMRRGAIVLIPKPGKDKTFISNWRPITLLSVFYKIISASVANRLKMCWKP